MIESCCIKRHNKTDLLCATERNTKSGHRKGSGIGNHPIGDYWCVCVGGLVSGVQGGRNGGGGEVPCG